MRRFLRGALSTLALLALAIPGLAQVNTLVTKGAPDAWVEPFDVAKLMPIPDEAKTSASVVEYWKTEVRVAGAQSQRYERHLTRVQSAAAMQDLGSLKIDFVQDFQSVKVHLLNVHRGEQVINILPTTTFRVTQMQGSQAQDNLTGRVQALAQIEDLRLGDRIEVAYTVSGQNTVFGDGYSGLIAWNNPRRSYNREVRVLSPLAMTIEHKLVGPQLPNLQVQRQNLKDGQELRVSQARVAPIWFEESTPRNIVFGAFLQLSSYKSWTEVQAWAQGLFKLGDAHPTVKDLAQRFVDEAALEEKGGEPGTNPVSPKLLEYRRRNLALNKAIRFVQEDVRYFSIALSENTHRPQLPHITLERRYGDCKDKTMLLAALLREMGIASTPVLVNSQETWRIQRYLPAPTVFDHVVLKFEPPWVAYFQEAGPEPLREAITSGSKGPFSVAARYVDSTRRIEGIPFNFQSDAWTGSLGLALLGAPASKGELELMGRPTPQPAVQINEQVTSTGLEGEAQFDITTRYFGRRAEQMRWAENQNGVDGRNRWLLSMFSRRHKDASVPNGYPRSTSNPKENSYATLERYKVEKLLTRDSQRNIWVASFGADALLAGLVDNLPGKSRLYPMAINAPYSVSRYVVQVQLPNGIEGREDPITDKLETPYFKLATQRSFRGSVFRFQADLTVLKDEISTNDFDAFNKSYEELRKKLLDILALNIDDMKGTNNTGQNYQQRQMGPYAQSETNATKVIDAGRLAPADLALAYLERAVARLALDKVPGAQQDLEQVRKSLPNDVRVIELSASLGMRVGKYTNAEADFSKALSLGAEPGNAYMRRGHARFLLGRYEEALQDFEQAERASESGVNVSFMQIWADLMRMKLGRRLQWTDRGNPSWPNPLLRLVAGRLKPEQVVAAAKAASSDEAISNLCEAYFYIGLWYWAKGDNSQRNEYLRRTLDTGVTHYMEYELARAILSQ